MLAKIAWEQENSYIPVMPELVAASSYFAQYHSTMHRQSGMSCQSMLSCGKNDAAAARASAYHAVGSSILIQRAK